MKLLSATVAAERLGVTPGRVRTFIGMGRLPAQNISPPGLTPRWVIAESDLADFASLPREPGRPKATKKTKRRSSTPHRR